MRRKGIVGFFKSKGKESKDAINIRGVRSVVPIENSHFEPPKDFNKTFKDDFIDIICQVSPAEK